MNFCQNPSPWAVVIALSWLAYALLEAWLGRTDKVKAGSVVELVITALIGLAMLGAVLFRKKEDK